MYVSPVFALLSGSLGDNTLGKAVLTAPLFLHCLLLDVVVLLLSDVVVLALLPLLPLLLLPLPSLLLGVWVAPLVVRDVRRFEQEYFTPRSYCSVLIASSHSKASS